MAATFGLGQCGHMFKDRQRLARWLLWFTPALWSSNYLIARTATDVIAPHQLALLRWTVAVALMLPFTWAALAKAPRTWLAEWPHLLVLGGLGMWVCGAFVYQGGHSTSALNIGLIYAACPVGIAWLGAKLLHERVTPARALGAALALLGVVVIITRGDLAHLRQVNLGAGDLWIAVAACAWVAYSVLLMRWKSVLAPAPRLAAIAMGGVVVMLPFTALEALVVDTPAFSLKSLGLGLAAALLPGALAYTAYSVVQRELGVARTALMLYLAPVYAALLAWALLGEAPKAYHAMGAALILPSIWLATRR